SEGLPALPDTRYVVSCNPRTVSELPQAIFQSLSQEIHPWETGTALTPEEGGNTLVL
ncbi:transcriptional regulator LrhA, partial [Klebsiella pneumoniae]